MKPETLEALEEAGTLILSAGCILYALVGIVGFLVYCVIGAA